MGILKMLGLITVEEYAVLDAKYKKAIVDLADEIEARNTVDRELSSATRSLREADAALANERASLATAREAIKTLRGQVANLAPDAEKFRTKAAKDAARKKELRATARSPAAPKPVAAKAKKGAR